jgi:phage terminase large subunit-like protein
MPGWPADVLLLDDLFRNWQQAHSPTTRNTAWNLLLSQARKRLQGWLSPIIFAGTRWHEDDPQARYLQLARQDRNADQWVVLRLAARAEPADPKAEVEAYRLPDPMGRAPGQIIEPQRFDEREVAARFAGSAYLANAQEQQRPTAQEGDDIKRAWFKIRDTAPPTFDHMAAFWDMKLKDNEAGDYVVGGCWGRSGSALWLIDVLRGQWNQDMTECAIVLMYVRHPQVRAQYIENTGNAPEVMAALRKAHPNYEVTDRTADELRMTHEERQAVQRIRRAGIGRLVPDVPKGSKFVRMMAQIGYLAGGDVWLLEAGWNDAYIDEMTAFGPNMAHDDQVDMTSMALKRMGHSQAKAKSPTGQVPTGPQPTRGGTTTGNVPTTPAQARPVPRSRVRGASVAQLPRYR